MLVRLAGGKQKRLDCVGRASGALASLPSQECAHLQHQDSAAPDPLECGQALESQAKAVVMY